MFAATVAVNLLVQNKVHISMMFFSQLNQAERLKQLVQQRKTYLKEKLANLPLGKAWTKYQKQTIYYQQQLDEYKKALQDPNLIAAKAFQLLSHVPSFRKFFDKYSVLGSMFRLPGQVEDMDPSTMLNGLQTRDAVMANITERMGTTADAQQAITAGMKEGHSVDGLGKPRTILLCCSQGTAILQSCATPPQLNMFWL